MKPSNPFAEWRPIPGHRGYEASDDGRIRNAATGHVLRQYPVFNAWEYPRVTVCMPGPRKGGGRGSNRRAVSRLVCAAFHGRPKKGELVRHLDGDPLHNAAGNLAWGSRKQNAEDGPGDVYDPEEAMAILDKVFGASGGGRMNSLPAYLNPLHDVSKDFRPSPADARVIRRILRVAETPQAIKLFAAEHRKLTDYSYWFVLGTLWVSYTGWSDLQQWKWLFSSKRPCRASSLMKPSELAAWHDLPDTLDLLRVHRPGETDWISYTLDPVVAQRIADRRGVPAPTPYRCKKTDALCLFLRRGEAEVLVLDRRHARWAGGAL